MEDISKTKTFAIFISVFYIFGILGAVYHYEILSSVLAFTALAILILFFNFGFKKSVFLYLIFFTGIIRLNCTLPQNTVLDGINTNDAIIKGQVISSKNISDKNQKIKFYLRADDVIVFNKESKNINTKMLISMDLKNNIENKILIGDYIEIEGKLRTPKASSNPYQFDYKNYLLHNGIKNILYAKTDSCKKIREPKLFKSKTDGWYYVLRKFELTRNKIIEKHSKNIKSPKLEVLGGIVFGNETINPDEKIKEDFRNSGLLHLLAASGLNVALIFGIWWHLAMLVRFPYTLAIMLGAVFVILYTFMTGFPPSILRASIMLLFVLFGKMIDRTVNSISLIFLVGFLILLANPSMLFDVGFQLSFAVTFGLVSCCGIILEKFGEKEKRYVNRHNKDKLFKKYFFLLFSPINLISVVLVPLIAQLWVLPLQMHYFNNFAPFSLPANIAVVPFIGILSFIGFISSIIALIPNMNDFMVLIFDSMANPLLGFLIKISEFFSSFKISLITTEGLSVFQIFNFWGIILAVVLNIKTDFKNKKHVIILIITALIFAFSFIRINKFSKDLEIIMFDTGNADCFLINTPKNKHILIDTGKLPYKGISSAQTIINKYFMNERIKSLDVMIVTHFDSDHSGGVIDILNQIKTKTVYIQKEDTNTKIAKDIIDYLKNNNINYKIAKNNEQIYKEENITLTTYKADLTSDNESSVITLLKYKDKNILFMADSAIEGFKETEKYLPNKINILKVGHHGAKGVINQDMINRIKPDYVLISAGESKFNHPHYSTVALLNKNAIKTITTKNYGFVKVKLKNAENEFKFYHYDSNDKKIKEVQFDKHDSLPFHKSEYVLNFVKNHTRQ